MTHDEARLLIGSAPGEVSERLAGHLARCPQCAQFQEQMRRMDQDLMRLLKAPLPLPADTRILPLPRREPRTLPDRRAWSGVLALAASVVVAIGMGILFWGLRPQPSLAAGVIGHVAQEPDSWSAVAPMTAAATEQALRGAGVSIDTADTTVTYARTCLFDGHWVPHLVVRTAGGPLTVMVLRHEHVASRQSFRQNGYSGILVPAPAGGTLAIIARGQPDLEALSRILEAHLHWAP